MNLSEPLRIEARWTLRDLRARSLLRMRPLLTFGAMTVLVVLVFDTRGQAASVVAGALVLATVIVLFKLQQRGPGPGTTWTLDDHGVRIVVDSGIESSMPWSAMKCVRVRGSFLAFESTDGMLALPTSGLPPETLRLVHQVVDAHVPTKAVRPRSRTEWPALGPIGTAVALVAAAVMVVAAWLPWRTTYASAGRPLAMQTIDGTDDFVGLLTVLLGALTVAALVVQLRRGVTATVIGSLTLVAGLATILACVFYLHQISHDNQVYAGAPIPISEAARYGCWITVGASAALVAYGAVVIGVSASRARSNRAR